MFQAIYNILVEILGESKQGSYNESVEQYQFNCCRCAEDNNGIIDNKHNLEILLSKRRGLKYHCWKCGDTDNMRGDIGTLIKRFGSLTHYRQYKEEISSIKKSQLYDIAFCENNGLVENVDSFIKLPKTYRKIEISNLKNKKLKNYINERNITQDIIDKFNIGYTEWDDEDWTMRNRIIIPSYDNTGDLNFYVGRDFSGKSKMKYKNCDADKKNIIFQESLIDWDSNVYLVEGVFDALVGPNFISLLGKSLVRDSLLFDYLYNKTNANIVICLDGDTRIEETKKIYNSLNFGRLRNKIWYINMQEDSCYKDFGEIYENLGNKGIIEILKKKKQFNEIDLMY